MRVDHEDHGPSRSEHEDGAGRCCAPSRMSDAVLVGERSRPVTHGVSSERHRVEQVPIPAQTFAMGDAQGDGRAADGERPVHPVSIAAFEIDATSVTNGAFADFVAATGYRTEAERFGYSAVFHLAFTGPEADALGVPPQTPWWLGVRGADWRHPGGRGSDIAALADHPVVHVSWNDAVAYCEWAGRALPTEAQWEAASRGGLASARYPWGDELRPGDVWRTNIWQGRFPVENTLDDGFLTTAPVRSFEPNGYGVWQTVGNVWEWCSDAWSADTYAAGLQRGVVHDPAGPSAPSGEALRVMRGGSYLCHDSYCNRYRNAARSSNTPDSSTGNIGFRTVGRA